MPLHQTAKELHLPATVYLWSGASPFGACLALLRKPPELRKMVDFVNYSSSGMPAPRIKQTSTLTWA